MRQTKPMDQQNADQGTNLRTGPTAALTAALDAERERLFRWRIYLTGQPDVADDLVQDTVAAAWMRQRDRAQLDVIADRETFEVLRMDEGATRVI